MVPTLLCRAATPSSTPLSRTKHLRLTAARGRWMPASAQISSGHSTLRSPRTGAKRSAQHKLVSSRQLQRSRHWSGCGYAARPVRMARLPLSLCWQLQDTAAVIRKATEIRQTQRHVTVARFLFCRVWAKFKWTRLAYWLLIVTVILLDCLTYNPSRDRPSLQVRDSCSY